MIYFHNSTKTFTLTDVEISYDIKLISDEESETWGHYFLDTVYPSAINLETILLFNHRRSIEELKTWLYANTYNDDTVFLIDDNLFVLGSTTDFHKVKQYGSYLFQPYLRRLSTSSKNSYLAYNSAGDRRYTNQIYKALGKLNALKFEQVGEKFQTALNIDTVGTHYHNRVRYFINILNIQKTYDIVVAVVENVSEFKHAVNLAKKGFVIVHPVGLSIQETRMKGFFNTFTVSADATYNIKTFSQDYRNEIYDSKLQNDEKISSDNYRENYQISNKENYLTKEDLLIVKKFESLFTPDQGENY